MPGVVVGRGKLRLNSEPVPPDAMPVLTGDHAARVAAATEWLDSHCGDYGPLRRRFVACYLEFAVTHLDAHRAEVTDALQRFDGLYAPEDFLWSALRPLPRGWVPVGDAFLPADIVFWDGAQAIAVELAARDTDRQKALADAGIAVLRLAPEALGRDVLEAVLPDTFRWFWRGEVLPSSPFRRAIPHGAVTTEA